MNDSYYNYYFKKGFLEFSFCEKHIYGSKIFFFFFLRVDDEF